MKVLRRITILVFCWMSVHVSAQESVHFSQYNNAMVMFNPATTGIFHGSMRASVHYRNQWGAAGNPYNTMGGAIDLPVWNDVTENDFFAAGGFAFQDKAGLSETTNFTGGVNLAYGKSFDPDEEHFWSVGVKVTYNQKSVNNNPNLNWGSQWDVIDGTGWTGSPGEPYGEFSKTFIGFGAGFNHFYTNHDNIRTMVGVSLNNINRPLVNFLNSEYQLNNSLFVHGEIEIHNHQGDFAIIPRTAMFFQGPQRYFIVGTSFDFLLKQAGNITGIVKEVTLEFGGFYRWNDALIFEVQANWAGAGLGFTYDLPVSRIGRAVNYVGAFEVMLNYKLGYKKGNRRTHKNDRFDSIH